MISKWLVKQLCADQCHLLEGTLEEEQVWDASTLVLFRHIVLKKEAAYDGVGQIKAIRKAE